MTELGELQRQMEATYGARDRGAASRQRSHGLPRKSASWPRLFGRAAAMNNFTNSATRSPGLHHWPTSSACRSMTRSLGTSLVALDATGRPACARSERRRLIARPLTREHADYRNRRDRRAAGAVRAGASGRVARQSRGTGSSATCCRARTGRCSFPATWILISFGRTRSRQRSSASDRRRRAVPGAC